MKKRINNKERIQKQKKSEQKRNGGETYKLTAKPNEAKTEGKTKNMPNENNKRGNG